MDKIKRFKRYVEEIAGISEEDFDSYYYLHINPTLVLPENVVIDTESSGRCFSNNEEVFLKSIVIEGEINNIPIYQKRDSTKNYKYFGVNYEEKYNYRLIKESKNKVSVQLNLQENNIKGMVVFAIKKEELPSELRIELNWNWDFLVHAIEIRFNEINKSNRNIFSINGISESYGSEGIFSSNLVKTKSRKQVEFDKTYFPSVLYFENFELEPVSVDEFIKSI